MSTQVTQILITIITAAFVGYITNKLALKMLFRPKKKLLGLQAIMIKRKPDLAESLAELVIGRLLGKELAGSEASVIDSVANSVATALVKDLIEELDLLESEAESVKAILMSEMQDICNHECASSHVQDLKQSLINNIIAIPDDEIESVTLSIVDKEFKTIENLGAVLGAVIGAISCLSLFA